MAKAEYQSEQTEKISPESGVSDKEVILQMLKKRQFEQMHDAIQNEKNLSEEDLRDAEISTDKNTADIVFEDEKAIQDANLSYPITDQKTNELLQNKRRKKGMEMGEKYDLRMKIQQMEKKVLQETIDSLRDLKKEITEAIKAAKSTRKMKIIGALIPVLGLWGMKKAKDFNNRVSNINELRKKLTVKHKFENPFDKSILRPADGHLNALSGDIMMKMGFATSAPVWIGSVGIGIYAIGILESILSFRKLGASKENLTKLNKEVDKALYNLQGELYIREIKTDVYGQAVDENLMKAVS